MITINHFLEIIIAIGVIISALMHLFMWKKKIEPFLELPWLVSFLVLMCGFVNIGIFLGLMITNHATEYFSMEDETYISEPLAISNFYDYTKPGAILELTKVKSLISKDTMDMSNNVLTGAHVVAEDKKNVFVDLNILSLNENTYKIEKKHELVLMSKKEYLTNNYISKVNEVKADTYNEHAHYDKHNLTELKNVVSD